MSPSLPVLTWDVAPIEEADVGTDRYLGQNSIPALLREQSSPTDKNDRVDIKQDMRSILGLDTSAPFPLMSSVHLQRLTQDIYTELPSDREVMKYDPAPALAWLYIRMPAHVNQTIPNIQGDPTTILGFCNGHR